MRPPSKGAGQDSSSEADDNLLPLLLRHEGGEGWGEEAVLMSFPLSLTLSPFVPHGERVPRAPGRIYLESVPKLRYFGEP